MLSSSAARRASRSPLGTVARDQEADFGAPSHASVRQRRSRSPRSASLVAGDGPERERLARRAAELDNIEFLAGSMLPRSRGSRPGATSASRATGRARPRP